MAPGKQALGMTEDKRFMVNQNNEIEIKVKPTAQEVVESMVGEVVWVSGIEGYCECPGRTSHTTQNGKKDCKIYLDKVPTLFCFHGSCKSEIETANMKLRQALMSGELGSKKGRLTAEDKARIQERQKKESIRKRAACSKARILKDYRWTYAEILRDSLVPVPENPAIHWILLLACFHPNDVIWIGDKFHSGKPEHSSHFRTGGDWSKESMAPAQFTCPATFKPGCYGRTNDNIVTRRFLVVESDILGRDEVGAVFKWLKDKVGLNLRAVVDTAGKSLHAWFDYPPEQGVEELKLVLPELDCDPKLFTASQPVRLPGALRDGKYQKLVFLGKEAAQ